MRLLSVIVLLVITFVKSGFANTLCSLPAKPNFTAKVVRVYDGDTVRLASGDKVRILGVNTPEMGKENEKKDEPGAIIAKQKLQALLAKSNYKINIYFDSKKVDRYGRLLAYISTSSGIDVSRYMIENGYGVFVAIPPNTMMADCYYRSEKTIRKRNLNNWAIVTNWNISDDAISYFKGGFAILRSKIISYSQSKTKLVILLSNGYKVIVGNKMKKYFAELKGMKGKTILIKNWVNQKNVKRKRVYLEDRRMLSLL